VETKIANPGPLGLAGFALTTFVLSSVNAGWFKATEAPVVIGLAVFYGGIAQFAAGMWEFRTGNTFGATAFSSYGAFWLSFAALLIPAFGVKGITDTGIGLYLLGWTIFTGIMFLGTFRVNGALVLVFLFLFITFLLLALGNLQANTTLVQFGGYTGVITAVIAWYTALAGVLSSVGMNILPVFPMAKAA
jgi:succinate-acetate transporter protein